MTTRTAGGGRPDLFGRGDPVESGHLDVEQCHVGRLGDGGGDGGRPVGDGGHYDEVGLQIEQRGQRTPDEVLVVGEQDADHDGIVARTVNQPPAGPTVS